LGIDLSSVAVVFLVANFPFSLPVTGEAKPASAAISKS
jgi:hypothetical protein